MMTEEEMAGMDWESLLAARKQALENKDYGQSKAVSPYEHRAYARETVAKNPEQFGAFNILPFGYQAAKMLGLGAFDPGTTPPSLTQLGQGLIGAFEGLDQSMGSPIKNKLKQWLSP